MKNDPKLVDVEVLKSLMGGVQLDEARLNEYINARWLKYVEWWDSRSAKAKWKYFTLRSAVVIGGVLIPALVAFHDLPRFANAAWVFSVGSVVVSVVVRCAPASKACSAGGTSGARSAWRLS